MWSIRDAVVLLKELKIAPLPTLGQPWGFGVFLLEALKGGTTTSRSWPFQSRDNSAGCLLPVSLSEVLKSLRKFTLEHQDKLYRSGMRTGRLLSYLLFNFEIIALSNIQKKMGTWVLMKNSCSELKASVMVLHCAALSLP